MTKPVTGLVVNDHLPIRLETGSCLVIRRRARLPSVFINDHKVTDVTAIGAVAASWSKGGYFGSLRQYKYEIAIVFDSFK